MDEVTKAVEKAVSEAANIDLGQNNWEELKATDACRAMTHAATTIMRAFQQHSVRAREPAFWLRHTHKSETADNGEDSEDFENGQGDRPGGHHQIG